MLFTQDIGIDLGTANTLVFVKGKGIVIREPSVVAVDVRSTPNKVVAVGAEAKEMIGRTPGSITAGRPLKDGVIADFDITAIRAIRSSDFCILHSAKNIWVAFNHSLIWVVKTIRAGNRLTDSCKNLFVLFAIKRIIFSISQTKRSEKSCFIITTRVIPIVRSFLTGLRCVIIECIVYILVCICNCTDTEHHKSCKDN